MRQWVELTYEEQEAVKKGLAYPFEPPEIEWLALATFEKDGGYFAKGGAYADLRAYQRRLDEVCSRNWTVRIKPLPTPPAGNIAVVASVTIYGRTLDDVGEADAKDPNAWTSAVAQAIKRACSAHEVGRYLYAQDAPWVPYDKQRKQITREGLATLNKDYLTWYMQVTGQKKPGERQQQQQQTPTGDSRTTPSTPPPPPATTTTQPDPDAPITDATKLAIYATAQAIFGEQDWTDALAWYTDAFSKTNMARTKSPSPDQFLEVEGQALLDAMSRNGQVLPEYWANAKTSIIAARAAASDRERSATNAQRQAPTGTAGIRPN